MFGQVGIMCSSKETLDSSISVLHTASLGSDLQGTLKKGPSCLHRIRDNVSNGVPAQFVLERFHTPSFSTWTRSLTRPKAHVSTRSPQAPQILESAFGPGPGGSACSDIARIDFVLLQTNPRSCSLREAWVMMTFCLQAYIAALKPTSVLV